MHVIPQETPNRQFPSPAPFMYHPELYPELAMSNPESFDFTIPKRKSKNVSNPRTLNCTVVQNPSLAATGFVDISKLMDSARFAKHRGYAFNKLDENAIN